MLDCRGKPLRHLVDSVSAAADIGGFDAATAAMNAVIVALDTEVAAIDSVVAAIDSFVAQLSSAVGATVLVVSAVSLPLDRRSPGQVCIVFPFPLCGFGSTDLDVFSRFRS